MTGRCQSDRHLPAKASSEITRLQGQHCPMTYMQHENGFVEHGKENPIRAPIPATIEYSRMGSLNDLVSGARDSVPETVQGS